MSAQSTAVADEATLRIQLAALYRLVHYFGWSDLIFTHISARLPGAEDAFLINPYGLLFDEITASSLVKINGCGEKLDDSPYPVNPAGFVIHATVHAARADVNCVLHTHSRAGVAVSAQRGGLLNISQQSTFIHSDLGYHDYEGVALNDDEKPRLARDLGGHRFLILRNHGLLTVGADPVSTFLAHYTFENACAIQIAAQTGAELIPIEASVQAGVNASLTKVTLGMGGQLVWPALLRLLDRIDPSYRS